MQRSIIWNITGECNMDCPYCLEGRDKPLHPTRELSDRRLDNLLNSLKGIWELRLNGGEVFDMPGFLDHFVPKILNQSEHTMAVLTNFTYPIEDIVRLFDMSKERLSFFSSSLHLVNRKKGERKANHTDPYEYLKKAKEVKKALAEHCPGLEYHVNCVLLPRKLEIIREFKPAYDEAGIPIFFQFLKVGISPNLQPYNYNEEQLKIIRDITGKDVSEHRTVNSARSYKGCKCFSGMNYFVIDEEGNAYNCHGSLNNPQHYMGNISESKLELRDRPITCPYDICTTSIPIIKGIVKDD